MATLSLAVAAVAALVLFPPSGEALPLPKAASPPPTAEIAGSSDTSDTLEDDQVAQDEDGGADEGAGADEDGGEVASGAADDDGGEEDTGEDEAAAANLEEVPLELPEVSDPIDLTATGDFETGLTIDVVRIEPVDGEASGRGEVAGPALRIEFVVSNGSSEAISLARMQIEVLHGEDLAPGMPLSGPDILPFPDEVRPGEEARSAVVFGVPLDRRDLIQIQVSSTTDAPTIVFEGSAV